MLRKLLLLSFCLLALATLALPCAAAMTTSSSTSMWTPGLATMAQNSPNSVLMNSTPPTCLVVVPQVVVPQKLVALNLAVSESDSAIVPCAPPPFAGALAICDETKRFMRSAVAKFPTISGLLSGSGASTAYSIRTHPGTIKGT
jgi:hypothetical protein